MLTHLLFSISALVFIIIFVITYVSYKKNTGFLRSKIYVYMISFTFALTIVEIIEGIAYVYNSYLIFSLMWKFHSILMVLFVATLFYYFLANIHRQVESIEDILWDNNKLFTIKNIFTIIFIIALILSIILIKAYPIGLTMFYFYTNQLISFILVLYLIYILYNVYIIYLKYKTNSFETNDYIILIGTFILFIAALIFEYEYPEISIYSTLFTLVLILLYYFKENEDLLIIEELQKSQINLTKSNNIKLNNLYELISDLDRSLNTFKVINNKLNNCSDEELKDDLVSLNYISDNLVGIINQDSNKNLKYRIDELALNIVNIIKLNFKDKPIDFIYSIDQNIPSMLMGDYRIIHRIIATLLINAIQYTNVGKITLTITGERQKDNILLNIKVADTGVGIKTEDYDKVLNSNNDYFDGNYNSNLALIKKSVEELNGNITFESHYGAGTTFFVNILQKIYNERPILEVPLVDNNIVINNYNNKKILLIDDELYSSNKFYSILKKYNFVIKCVNTGLEAINTIKCDEDYKLIIVTDNVKDYDFGELGALLKKLGKFVDVPPIIALITNKEEYYANHVYDEYLLKPLNLEKLNEIFEKYINK